MSKTYYLAVRAKVFEFKSEKVRGLLMQKLNALGMETAIAEAEEAKK